MGFTLQDCNKELMGRLPHIIVVSWTAAYGSHRSYWAIDGGFIHFFKMHLS